MWSPGCGRSLLCLGSKGPNGCSKVGEEEVQGGGTCGKHLAAGCQGWGGGFPLLPASWIRDVGTAGDAAGALQQAWWEAIVSPLGKKGSGAWQRT